MRLILKCVCNKDTRRLFADLLRSFDKEFNKASIALDINPSTL